MKKENEDRIKILQRCLSTYHQGETPENKISAKQNNSSLDDESKVWNNRKIGHSKLN